MKMQLNNQCQQSARFLKKESGSVLIVVLWISLGLVGVALTFGSSMFMEYKASDNIYAASQAQQTIEGSMKYVEYVIQTQVEEQELTGTLIDTDYYQMADLPLDDSRFWFIGRDIFSQYTITEPYFNLVDEAAKLNLNTATQEMLEMLPLMTPELAARIIDWRDEDDEITDGGAESNTYQRRNPAHYAKNAEFESIEEVRLLLEEYPEVLYGEDMNRNGILDPNENDGEVSMPLDNSDGYLDMGILEYVTVYSKLSATMSDGTARIDVTADDTSELDTLIADTFGGDVGGQNGGGQGGGTPGSVLEWYLNSGLTAEQFAQIEDQLIAGEEDQIGLININTASEAVLACIPGVGENGARQIVNYRIANPYSLTTVAWIAEVLPEADFTEIGPLVTGRSYQYTADVAAVGRDGRGYRRTAFVFDLSEQEPVILFRRDLSGLGWALGQEVREQLALNTEQ